MPPPVPARVARVFKPVGTIGPSLYIALVFIKLFIVSRVTSFLGKSPEDKAKEAAARVDAQLAVDLLDLESLRRDCDERLGGSDPRERLAPNEHELYLHVARLIAGGVVRDYRDTQAKLPAQMATRSQHAKQHGCLKAHFIVDDQLPAEFAIGVFQPGVRYNAMLRFSNAHGTPQADCKGDGRGMAIKLMPTDGKGEQDFVLVNHPVFIVDNVAEYSRFMEIIHGRDGMLLLVLRLIGFFVPWRLRKAGIFLSLLFTHIENPLNATYHSMSPFALGERVVVRYVVMPVGRGPSGTAPTDAPDFLRERLAERLASDGTEAADSIAAFTFAVQIRDKATPEDVEHASRPWRRPQDRVVPLARIEVPHQTFANVDQLCSCENLRFTPWNVRPEHRPLGGINRIRLLVYLASARMRHRLNMVEANDTVGSAGH